MSYNNLDAKIFDEKRLTKKGFKIIGCMSYHIFEYVLILTIVFTKIFIPL